MFVILPVGLERSLRRGWPYVSLALLGIVAGVFLLTWPRMENKQTEQGHALRDVVMFNLAKPYTKLPEDVMEQLTPELQATVKRHADWVAEFDADPVAAEALLMRSSGPMGIMNSTEQAASQADATGVTIALTHTDVAKYGVFAKLVGLGAAHRAAAQYDLDTFVLLYRQAVNANPRHRYGYTPTRGVTQGLMSHMFLHAGWLHLIFNLIFLYIAAIALEDIWTGPALLGVFIFTGVVAALTFAATTTKGHLPMVGASGAVSGCMGALFIRLRHTRIRFFYAYWLMTPRWGNFSARASLMLPLWLISELISALTVGNISPVAYWAHIGGFVGGGGLALLLKAVRFEERVLRQDPADFHDGEEVFNLNLALTAKRRPRNDGSSPLMARAAAQWSAIHPEVRPRGASQLGDAPTEPTAIIQPAAAVALAPPQLKQGSVDPLADTIAPVSDDTELSLGQETVRATPLRQATPSQPEGAPEERRIVHIVEFEAPLPKERRFNPLDGSPTEVIGPSDGLVLALVREAKSDSLAAYAACQKARTFPLLSAEQEMRLARYLEEEGQALEAARTCQRAAEQDLEGPQAPRALYHVGRLLFDKLDALEAGLTIFRRIQADYPDSEYAQRVDAALARIAEIHPHG